jgi:hypothetical protein
MTHNKIWAIRILMTSKNIENLEVVDEISAKAWPSAKLPIVADEFKIHLLFLPIKTNCKFDIISITVIWIFLSYQKVRKKFSLYIQMLTNCNVGFEEKLEGKKKK